MTRRRLRLRGWGAILAAYVVAPAVAAAVIALPLALLLDGGDATPQIILLYLMAGSVTAWTVGFALELVIATPLLIAFHRYGWRWLNGYSAVLIGFLAGCAPILVADQADAGSGSWVISALGCGLTGAAGGGAFRLIAVRSIAEDSPAAEF